jgi:hypothetical protein
MVQANTAHSVKKGRFLKRHGGCTQFIRGCGHPLERRIRDPDPRKNPGPNQAEFETQPQPAAPLTAISKKSRIVKYAYVRVSWSVSPQEQ